MADTISDQTAHQAMSETSLEATPATADDCFELGMIHSSGRTGAIDMVTAHMWFNIAASRGHTEAAQLRREVAAQMTDREIGTAQRAARDWLKAHPLPGVIAPALCVAA